jgi:adenine-specific DNA-methyltransferase
MANEIQELLTEIKDDRLKARLSAAIAEFRKTKKFGLVFEEHLPELLPIYSAQVRSQARVARKDGRLTDTYIVQRVTRSVASVTSETGVAELQNIPVAELVVVKRFGEAIFPALRHVESVLRGGEAPHHTLIEADNYHALQLLEWLYAGKVDCIYIDPPYNTGARDWKYNNDYVDKADSWKHSKWLSFMKKRLVIAKKLLKPGTGVLIVTIDEHEVSHLGVLLEAELKDYYRQMVTVVINPKGVTQGRFSRVEEYAFFCFPNGARVYGGDDDLLSFSASRGSKEPRWKGLLRSGTNARRADRKNMFFPVLVDPDAGAVADVGDPLPFDEKPKFGKHPSGLVPVWPVRSDMSLGNWGVGHTTLRALIKKGYVQLGRFDKERNTYGISYLSKRPQKQIETGELVVVGRDKTRNVVKVEYREATERQTKSVWHRTSHDAGAYGSDLLGGIIGEGRKFPFPKSLYAVKDALASIVREQKAALIVDFFAGSGTTAHATALLNAEDGGQRRCILVTNNAVSDEDERRLKGAGHFPGDPEWESHGICQSITYPRCKFAIAGRRDDGTELSGECLTGSVEQQEVRRAIRPMDFASLETLANKKTREALAMTVGFPKSKITGDESFLLAEGKPTAVLFQPDSLDAFIEQGEELAEGIEIVYLPFPSGREFNEAKAKVFDSWPPLQKLVDIKRPMKEGFAANLDYFRLDFLDRSHVETGGQMADILPVLWLMAGSRGKLPTCKGNEKMLFFRDCPFAILTEQSAVKSFLAKLGERLDIDWVFIVTNDQDSFSRMCEWLPEHIPVDQRIHLWRNYVDNFLINVDNTGGAAP